MRGVAVALVATLMAVPATAAFDPAADTQRFQQLHAMPIDDAATRAMLERDQLANPPYFLFELARRTLATDRAAAARWFMTGLIRVDYDGKRCRDATARNGLTMLAGAAPDVATYLRDDPAARKAAVMAAMARPDLFAATASPGWACLHGLGAMQNSLSGKPALGSEAILPPGEWPAIQSGIRQEIAKAFP